MSRQLESVLQQPFFKKEHDDLDFKKLDELQKKIDKAEGEQKASRQAAYNLWVE